MSITKQVIFIAKRDDIQQMKTLLLDMVEPSKTEDGCMLYEIFQSKEDRAKFIVIESWKDEKALDGHRASKHYAYYKSHYEPYCAEKSSEELKFI